MADKTQQADGAAGFLDSIRSSPATQQLTEHARGLLQAQAERATNTLGNKLGSVTDKLGEVSEGGSLPMLGEGAKRMLSGDSPAKSAVGAAASGVANKAKDVVGKVTGGRGTGKSKATDIEESIDVGVPVSTAYNQWTQFTEFTRFMKGVESVEQTSDTETTWRAKVFKSRRSWRATIQEQVPDERIVWTSEGAKGSTKGVVTFHPLAENLTRVLLTIEYYPSGFFEKTGNIWRAAGRRARLDLKNFRRFVMMEGQETGEWRGEIHDAEVVEDSDEQDEQDEQDDEGSGDAEQGEASGEADERDESRPRRGARGRRASAAATKSAPRKSADADEGGRRRPGRKAARQAPAKKAPAKKVAAKKAPAKKAAAKKAPAKKAAAKKAPAKKVAAKKAPAKKAAARKSAPQKRSAGRGEGRGQRGRRAGSR
jgi:uncharacterized membrane protein